MTLQQVAEKAGVSASTVSRVINSMPGITASTAENVRKAMQALQYTPTLRRRPAARPGQSAMAGAKVGFVVLDIASRMSTVPAYDYLLRGVSAAAIKHEVDLNVSFISDDAAAVARLANSGLDGLILHGTFHPADLGRPLQHIPTVWLMGNRRRPTWGDQIMPDNAIVGQVAAQHLLRHNHRHVMYFGMRSGWSIDIRMLAFQQAMDDAGGTVTTIAQRLADFDHSSADDVETGLKALTDAYQAAKVKPTGLFVAEDYLVRGVYAVFRAMGVEVGAGKGLEVISCNNDRAHLLGVDPMPATIDIRYEGIGYRAVEQLAHRLTHRGGVGDRVRIMLEPTIVLPNAGA